MNGLKIIAILILSFFGISCNAQKMLTDVAAIKGVTSVYVGKTMLKLASSHLGSDDLDDAIDISKLVGKLNSIEIIQCESRKTVAKATAAAYGILSQYPFEVLTEVRDGDDNIEISCVLAEDGETVTMLLIKMLEDDDEMMLILMRGAIDPKTLQSALKTN